CIYSWRNWFRALCGAIVLMAFLENHDMPHRILGIDGLNLWNLLLLNVIGGWLSWRNRTGVTFDMPRALRWAFVIYAGVVVWAFLRFFIDPTPYYQYSRTAIVIDYLINPVRYLVPCFLFYDGCHTRENLVWALAAIVAMYFLLALQVVKYMGLNLSMSGEALTGRAAKTISATTGYNRVDMSMMLAGASWAFAAFAALFERKVYRRSLWAAAAFVVLAQAMTGGRTGYVTWGLIGLTLCLLRWRKALPFIPIGAVCVVLLLPGVRQRMLEGFGGRQGSFIEQTDSSEITAGRTNIWPYVIEKIMQRPLIGYGRLGMVRTGLADWAKAELQDDFAHPHNAYLELLLDDGVVGFFLVMPLFWMLLRRSASLFIDRRDKIFEAAGGVALALLLALCFAAMGAQTFYPRESVVGMWAAVGVMLRTYVQRERSFVLGTPLFDEDELESEEGLVWVATQPPPAQYPPYSPLG
ncbi:MAG: O-antigen ligase family protein, partial [Bryobacteraceae bacterium]